MQIKSKDNLCKYGLPSPDKAEALMLAFAPSARPKYALQTRPEQLNGHRSAAAQSVLYDNTKLAIARILRDGRHRLAHKPGLMYRLSAMTSSDSRAGRTEADVFRAIADPTRRRILDLLAESEKPVKALVEAFDVTQPAISQHLRVLREAGLVDERRIGRERRYRLRAGPLREISGWVARYERFWTDRVVDLRRRLDKLSRSLGEER